MTNIVASKKCEICDSKILIVSQKITYGKYNNVKTINKELEHYCDGGESKFIAAHEISDKEYFERYSPDVNNWEGWNYLQR